MKTYKITYTETIVHEFYVDADSIDEAEDKFNENASNFDFGRGDVVNTSYEIEEEEN